MQFWGSQGPVARIEWREATQILRAGNFASSHRYASPVMGFGERRIWTRSVHPEPSPGAFWLLCRHGQSNPPSADGGIPLRTTNLFLNLSPHPSGLTASHLPPRGKALKRSSPSGFSPPRGRLKNRKAAKSPVIKKFYFPSLCFKYTISTATSAGDTPDTRLACPRFLGRMRLSFCRASSRSPSMAV